MKTRSHYFNEYSKHKKDHCEKCNSNEKLLVHHLDNNMSNNVISNLQTLCKRCHQIEHQCWLNLKDRTGKYSVRRPKICEWCEKQFLPCKSYQIQKYCSRTCAMLKRNNKST